MRSSLALVCLVLSPLLGAPVARADGARIVVRISGLRSSNGSVRGALFASRDDWTVEGGQIATCRGSIHAGHATCVFDGVLGGSYAFAFLHDENDNGALDRDWIGIPQEGFGFSNDAAPGFGPPSYESARFVHDGGGDTTITARARYVF